MRKTHSDSASTQCAWTPTHSESAKTLENAQKRTRRALRRARSPMHFQSAQTCTIPAEGSSAALKMGTDAALRDTRSLQRGQAYPWAKRQDRIQQRRCRLAKSGSSARTWRCNKVGRRGQLEVFLYVLQGRRDNPEPPGRPSWPIRKACASFAAARRSWQLDHVISGGGSGWSCRPSCIQQCSDVTQSRLSRRRLTVVIATS